MASIATQSHKVMQNTKVGLDEIEGIGVIDQVSIDEPIRGKFHQKEFDDVTTNKTVTERRRLVSTVPYDRQNGLKILEGDTLLWTEVIYLADGLPCSDEHVGNAQLYYLLDDANVEKQVRVVASLALDKLEGCSRLGGREVLKVE